MDQDKDLLIRLYRSIPVGKDHAVSRARLSTMWGMGDRSVRLAIAEIREKAKALNLEYFIVSDSQGKGYWRTKDRAEIQEFNQQMMSRVKSIAATVHCARAYLCETSQIDLFDGLYI
jgi:hypothetical protein